MRAYRCLDVGCLKCENEIGNQVKKRELLKITESAIAEAPISTINEQQMSKEDILKDLGTIDEEFKHLVELDTTIGIRTTELKKLRAERTSLMEDLSRKSRRLFQSHLASATAAGATTSKQDQPN